MSTPALPRVAVVGLWHETNTYSPVVTDLTAFREFELLEGAAIAERHRGTRSVIGGFLDAARVDVEPVFSAGAWPSGPATRGTIDELFDRMTATLDRAHRRQPFSGVLLNLHGAMVAEGCDDVEARTVELVRSTVGDVPVAAVLDLHANPSAEFVGATDVVISYDTYPHVDMWERGAEAAGLLGDALGGRDLVTVIAKVPLLTCPLAQATDAEPMRGLVTRARDRAARVSGARVGITAGFPYSDVARAGISVLVVGDRGDANDLHAIASATADDVRSAADRFAIDRPAPADAVARALRADQRPVVLADVADNVGGGSPGDGTVLLSELLRQEAPDAVVTIADPDVAAAAARTGPGGRITATLGGKSDRLHGDPVPIDAEILAVSDGRYTTRGSWMTGASFDMGTTVLLRVGGVRVIVCSRPTPPFHAEQFEVVGIAPRDLAVVVMKGAVAWRSAIEDPALVIEVDTPGACPIDLSRLPRRHRPVGT
ncbi:M81 family metallopeptidase [Desertimonas flava]|uniref:M81 family metallopeptidase n=1 Tax=Desertimonas flava TaxID=2064846 RepID=UPI0013C51004|nr:M81 family metallopeptidase [Desertimonas flava]